MSDEDQPNVQPTAEDMETYSSESNTENHADVQPVADGMEILIPKSN